MQRKHERYILVRYLYISRCPEKQYFELGSYKILLALISKTITLFIFHNMFETLPEILFEPAKLLNIIVCVYLKRMPQKFNVNVVFSIKI